MSSTVCQACFLAKAKEEIIEFYDDLSICKSCMNKLGATETEQTTSPSSVTVKLEEPEQTSGEAVNPWEKLEEPEQTSRAVVDPPVTGGSDFAPYVTQEADLLNVFANCKGSLYTSTAYAEFMLHSIYRDWKPGDKSASLMDKRDNILYESSFV